MASILGKTRLSSFMFGSGLSWKQQTQPYFFLGWVGPMLVQVENFQTYQEFLLICYYQVLQNLWEWIWMINYVSPNASIGLLRSHETLKV